MKLARQRQVRAKAAVCHGDPQGQQRLLQPIDQLKKRRRRMLRLKHQGTGLLPHLQAIEHQPRRLVGQHQLVDGSAHRRHLSRVDIAQEGQGDMEVGGWHRLAAAQRQAAPPLGDIAALGITDRQGEKTAA